MLKGFEEQTEPLTEYEQDIILPVILAGMKNKVGVKNAVTNKIIVSTLSLKGYKVSQPRIRKVINHIRNNAMLPGLVSSSKGYWITDDKEEIAGWILSLRGREDAIRHIREKAEQYLKTL